MKRYTTLLGFLALLVAAPTLAFMFGGGGGGGLPTSISNPADNETLLYDNVTRTWKNGAVTSAAGGDMAKSTYDADTDNRVNAAAGGTDIDTSASTGFPKISAGTWSVEAAATHRTSIGVGSISTQAADNVNIDGGTIDGTTIGATTPAAGTFSSLTLGDVSNTEFGYLNGVTSAVQTQIDGKQATDADLTTLSNLGNWRIPYTNGSAAVQTDLSQGAANTVLTSTGTTSAPSWGLVGTANVTDNSLTMADLASTLTGTDNATVIDLSAITQSAATNEGIAIPLWADVAPTSDKPWLTWDATGNQFKVYDGGWVTVGGTGGGGGAPTDAQYLVMALDGTLSAERAVTATAPVTFTAASSTSAVIAIDNASATARGVSELATNAEAQAGTANGSSGPLVVTPGNLVAFTGTSSIATVGTITSGTWNGTDVANAAGGTGQDSSGWTGVPVVASGTWSADASGLDVANGGTGATTAAGARTNLGLGTIATQAASSVSITGGTMDSVTVTKGTIDNTVIGATTAAAGTFTTLTANSVSTGSGTDGTRRMTMNPNTSFSPSAAAYELYVEGTTWKMNENGTERIVLLDSNSATLTGTSWSFASVTNMVLPYAAGRTADATGEVAINTTDNTLRFNVNGRQISVDVDGDSSGYVLKSDGSGNFTLQADATGGTPTLDSISAPTADSTFQMDATEEVNFNYTGNFTTGSQFKIEQLTGNPSGGVLFEVKAADSDVNPMARFGDGTNVVNVSQSGNVTLGGTATITAGGIILGDSTPDAAGEIGYSGGEFWFSDGGPAIEVIQNKTTSQQIRGPLELGEGSSGGALELIGATSDNTAYIYFMDSGDLNQLGGIEIDNTLISGELTTIISATADNNLVFSGETENITLSLDNNVPVFSSTTGVTGLDFSSLNLSTTGTISGSTPVFVVTDNTTLTRATNGMNTMVFVDNVARTITLPEVVASSPSADQVVPGAVYCVQVWGAHITRVDPHANDGIRLDGAASRDTNGDAIASTAAAGSQICVFADSASGWSTTSKVGTWAAE